MDEKKPEDATSPEIEIDVVDDTPEPDKDKPAASVEAKPEGESEGPLPEEPDENELKSYSDRVRERISKLTARSHNERRAKESAARQLDEAAKALKTTIDENNRLKTLVHQSESFLKDTNKGRLEAQIAQARADYKTAYESGDADALAKAQEKMSSLHAELSQTNAWNPQPLPPTKEPDVLKPQVQPDEQAADWQTRNQWFGRDVRMTGFALGVHQELVQAGVDPRSSDYYNRIDQEMVKQFPDRFNKPAREVPVTTVSVGSGASVVAPAGRANAGKSPRKVQLTGTQVALAKRLGVTPQQYAEQVLKLGNQND